MVGTAPRRCLRRAARPEAFSPAARMRICCAVVPLRGRAFLIRYADDAVMGFAREDDARRVQDVLPQRFGKYGLALHSEDTRLVPFRRPPLQPAPKGQPPANGPDTFDLLGFTHYWSRSRQGNWVAKRKTAKSCLTRVARTATETPRPFRLG